MRILELHLHTSRLEALRRFYTDTLGLPLVASEADRFEVQAGASRLAFRSTARGRPFYHFAFNIPAGALPAAKRFLQSRVELLTEDGADEFDSSLLQSRQVYFLDPAGNIGEFISPDSKAPQSAAFTINDILGISEIGLSTPTFAATVTQLCSEFGVAPLRQPSEDFGALGTLAGRFIVVSEGRHWFPTATGAEIHPFEALVEAPIARGCRFPDLPYAVTSVSGPKLSASWFLPAPAGASIRLSRSFLVRQHRVFPAHQDRR